MDDSKQLRLLVCQTLHRYGALLSKLKSIYHLTTWSVALPAEMTMAPSNEIVCVQSSVIYIYLNAIQIQFQ